LAKAIAEHRSNLTTATCNSVATLLTRDFYLHWQAGANQKTQIHEYSEVLVLGAFGAQDAVELTSGSEQYAKKPQLRDSGV
jgi:hypothetical protein